MSRPATTSFVAISRIRTLAEMYFSVQNYAPANPRPYDDTGWTFQYMRNVTIRPVADKAFLDQPMTLLTADAKAPGAIDGTGSVIVVEHTTDNNLMAFRFKHADVKMQAAEEDFELNGHKLRAGAFIIPNADRAQARANDQGPRTVGVGGCDGAVGQDARPRRAAHRLRPQLVADAGRRVGARGARHLRGALHLLRRHQAARGQPPIEVRRDHLSARRRQRAVAGQRHSEDRQRSTAVQEVARSFRAWAPTIRADDIRGGMGFEGLVELVKFVQQGGTLITEGSTSTILPEYNITPAVTVENPAQLFVRGSIVRGVFADKTSPLAYGFDGRQIPVYFNQDPVLAIGRRSSRQDVAASHRRHRSLASA